MSLRQRTVNGVFWNMAETLSAQVVNLISVLVLARLLSAEIFGVVAVCTIFIALSQVFVDGGFTQALIRKQNCTTQDYSTVFWVNLVMGIVLYGVVSLCAPLIANYFNHQELRQIIPLMMLVLPISSLSIIQRTILIKDYRFKVQAIVNLSAVIVGLAVAITMALSGFGVWSIVVKQIVTQSIITVGFWVVNQWRPSFSFSKNSFTTLFGFGSRLMIIYAMSALFSNVYKVIIGKFDTKELGYYTNSDVLVSVLSNCFSTMLNKVGYTTLSQFQDTNERFVEVLKSLMRPLYYVVFTMFACLAAMSGDLIPALFGEHWQPASYYFAMLCIGYMAYIAHLTNQLIMNVKGRSNYFLTTEIIKYALFVPVILVGIHWGLRWLLIALVIHCWVGFPINAIYSHKLVGYGIGKQLKDMLSPLLVAAVIGGAIYPMSYLPFESHIVIAVLQGLAAILLAVIIDKVFRLNVISDLLEMLHSVVHRKG